MAFFDVAVVGNVGIDTNIYLYGNDIDFNVEANFSENLDYVGQAGGYTSRGYARLGKRTAFIGYVGDDYAGNSFARSSPTTASTPPRSLWTRRGPAAALTSCIATGGGRTSTTARGTCTSSPTWRPAERARGIEDGARSHPQLGALPSPSPGISDCPSPAISRTSSRPTTTTAATSSNMPTSSSSRRSTTPTPRP